MDKKIEQNHDRAYATLFSIVIALVTAAVFAIVAAYGFDLIKNAGILAKSICFFCILAIFLVTIVISDRSEGRWSKKSNNQ